MKIDLVTMNCITILPAVCKILNRRFRDLDASEGAVELLGNNKKERISTGGDFPGEFSGCGEGGYVRYLFLTGDSLAVAGG
jgi:hypothetical protein